MLRGMQQELTLGMKVGPDPPFLPSFLFSFIQLTMNFEGTKGLFVKDTVVNKNGHSSPCPRGAYSPGWRILAAVPKVGI